MAKVIVETNDQRIRGTFDWLRVGLLGAALGLIVLALTWLIGNFIVDPLVCRSGALDACGQSEVLSGNIAAVIAAVIGAGVLIRLRVYLAIWVALSALVAFWGVGALTSGLHWIETAAWLATLYALAYLLFAHIFRIRSVFVAVIVTIVTILVLRWVAFL